MAEVRIYVLGVNMLFWGANATLSPPVPFYTEGWYTVLRYLI